MFHICGTYNYKKLHGTFFHYVVCMRFYTAYAGARGLWEMLHLLVSFSTQTENKIVLKGFPHFSEFQNTELIHTAIHALLF